MKCKCFLIGCCDVKNGDSRRRSLVGWTKTIKKGSPDKPEVVELILVYE